jgi:hypothetical protein
MSFRESLSKFWNNVQYTLLPFLERDVGELSPTYKTLSAVLELVRIEDFLTCSKFLPGRPTKARTAIARAYIAKVVLKLEYTKVLIEKLNDCKQLRAICGFGEFTNIPSESTFSRAFNEFAKSSLPERVHKALIKDVFKDQVIENIIKDSCPLEVREKALRKERTKSIKTKRVKKLKKGELNRRQKQILEKDTNKSVNDLPIACDKGMKKSAHGYTEIWKGYKVHAAVTNDCIPLAVIVTSASLNDCEVAIPLAEKCKFLTSYYDLMDAAYDHKEIKEHSLSLGHIPIIDKCPTNKSQKIEKDAERQRKKILNFQTAEDRRYRSRFKAERFNALFKDYYGGRSVKCRGHTKVFSHVMFGVLTLTATLLIKLIQ